MGSNPPTHIKTFLSYIIQYQNNGQRTNPFFNTKFSCHNEVSFLSITIFVQLSLLVKPIGGLICQSDCKMVFWKLYEALTCLSCHLMFQSIKDPHNEIELLYEKNALRYVSMFCVSFRFSLQFKVTPSYLLPHVYFLPHK